MITFSTSAPTSVEATIRMNTHSKLNGNFIFIFAYASRTSNCALSDENYETVRDFRRDLLFISNAAQGRPSLTNIGKRKHFRSFA